MVSTAPRTVSATTPRTGVASQRAMRGLVAVGVVSVGWWLIWLADFSHAGNPPLYALLMAAQLFSVIQVLGYWHCMWHRRPPRPRPASNPDGWEVDVLITTYNEPYELVARTVAAAVAMNGPHRTWVLDDGRRVEFADMARRLGAGYLTRKSNKGAKAGNLNAALRRINGEFIAVLDADHVPRRDFLERLMPWTADPAVAVVQAPQHYGNRRNGFVAGGAMEQQDIFFGAILEGKDGCDSSFCCGTNMVVRRSALDQIGGFDEDSVTEDAATTVSLHECGWKTRYVNEIVADGLAPEDLAAYLSQQYRWARGNLQLLLSDRLWRPGLRLSQRLQYAWSAAHYLSSFSTLVYLMLPCLALVFGVQPMGAATTDFVSHFLPYLAISLAVFLHSNDGNLRFRGIQLSFGLFPTYLSALASVIAGRKVGFVVTPKVRQSGSFYRLVWPQLLVMAMLLAAMADGALHYGGASTVSNECWCVVNLALLRGVVKAAANQPVRRRSAQPVPAVRGVAA
jgi:cellulose synthase (UDP-forming)